MSAGRQMREALERELPRWRVEFSFGWRKKHPAVFLRCGGQERVFCFPGSPSDRRSVLNQVSDLRKMLRAMGAEVSA